MYTYKNMLSLREVRPFLVLLGGNHLQAMFELAEKAIGVFHFLGGFWLDPMLLRQFVEHCAGLLSAQLVVASARDQLLCLNEKFDFANAAARSEGHTSELQSLMRISYAVFCLKKKIKRNKHN